MPSCKNQIYCEDCKKDKNIKRKTTLRMEASVRINGTGQNPEMSTLICKHCGREFLYPADREPKQFCSSFCRTLHEKGNACAGCGKTIKELGLSLEDIHTKYGHFFCSDQCYVDWLRRTGKYTICKFCGKEFPNPTLTKQFCNSQCQHAWQKMTAQRKPLVKCTCVWCGNEFEKKQNQNKKFCSRDCSAAYQKDIYQKIKDADDQGMSIDDLAKINPDAARLKASRMEAARKRNEIAQRTKADREAEKGEELRAQKAEERAKRDNFIKKHGLCSICKTPYKECERMQTNFRVKPQNASYKNGLIMKCDKFKG